MKIVLNHACIGHLYYYYCRLTTLRYPNMHPFITLTHQNTPHGNTKRKSTIKTPIYHTTCRRRQTTAGCLPSEYISDWASWKHSMKATHNGNFTQYTATTNYLRSGVITLPRCCFFLPQQQQYCILLVEQTRLLHVVLLGLHQLWPFL